MSFRPTPHGVRESQQPAGIPRPAWSLVVSVLWAAIGAAALLAALDAAYLLLVRRPVFYEAAEVWLTVAVVGAGIGAAAVVVGLVEGTLLAAAAWLLRRASAHRRALVGAVFAIGPAWWLAVQLLSGRRAQQLGGRELIIAAVALAAAAGAYGVVRAALVVHARLARGQSGRLAGLLALALALCAAGLHLADQRLLVGLYPAFHAALALGSFACAQLAVALLLALLRWRPLRARLGATLVSVALLAAGAWSLGRLRGSEQLRYLALEHTALHAQLASLVATAGMQLSAAQIAPALSNGSGPPVAAPARRGPRVPGANLVLITVDALRADHLGVHGYQRATSPRIDRWARQAVVFERGYCPTPHTSFSIASLMTGRHIYSAVSGSYPTIAATLRRAGYRTAAFFPPSVFFTDAHRLGPMVANRFDFETVVYEHSNAAKRIDKVLAFLTELDPKQRFFIWLHLFDPHEPYRPHPEHAFGPRDIDRYDGEIAFVDEHVGRLLDQLARHSGSTVVALTADHGEAFGEHGSFYHGNSLYDEQVRVPAIISVPGVEPRRVAGAVHSFDLTVTMLAVAGVPIPPQARGTDLGPWLVGEPPSSLPPVFIEIRKKKGIVFGGHKLIHDTLGVFSELYDLQRDPGERVNLAGREPALASELRARLLRWLGATAETLDDPQHVARLLQRARNHDQGAIPALVQLVERGSASVRLQAVLLLTELRAVNAREVLIAARDDEDPRVKEAAAIGAARLGDRDSLPAVRALLARDPSPSQRRAALLALAENGAREVAAELAAALDGELDQHQRVALVGLLGRLKDPAAAPALRRQLDIFNVRRHAMESLGLIGDREAVPLLSRAVREDRYVSWRKTAVWALGQIGDPRAAEPLRQAVRHDSEEVVVSHALAALARLRRLPVPGCERARCGPWRCRGRRCRCTLAVRRPGGKQLLLLLQHASVPLTLTAGKSELRRVVPLQNVPNLDRSDQPVPAVMFTVPAEANGRLVLVAEIERPKVRPPRVRYAALRSLPQAEATP